MSQPWPCYPVKPPPRGEDLPYDDGVPMESETHVKQMTLLIESLELGWAGRDDFYVGGNMFVYFSELQSKKNDFRGPDVFVVLDTVNKLRRSWVVWEEGGRTPDVVIEITSPSTEAVDRGEKKRIYASILHTAEYFLYDPFEKRLEGYRLDPQSGGYEPMTPDERGWYRSKKLGLWLGVQQGTYHRRDDLWLRWIDDDGSALPSGGEQAAEELAKAAEERAKAADERARADEERARADAFESREQQAQERLRVAARALLATGQSPSEVASLLGISIDELGK